MELMKRLFSLLIISTLLSCSNDITDQSVKSCGCGDVTKVIPQGIGFWKYEYKDYCTGEIKTFESKLPFKICTLFYTLLHSFIHSFSVLPFTYSEILFPKKRGLIRVLFPFTIILLGDFILISTIFSM